MTRQTLHRRFLATTAWAETATLVILLVNIATVHDQFVTSAVGRLHGGLYVACAAACVAARWVRGWSWPLVVVTLLPAIGPVVALERLRREERTGTAGPDAEVQVAGRTA